MDPREDDDTPYDSDDNDQDNDPIIRELRNEMVRLEAQLDQLIAADRERGQEIAVLRARLTELEIVVERLRDRYRRGARMWGWIAGFYGAAIGIWIGWLLRMW